MYYNVNSLLHITNSRLHFYKGTKANSSLQAAEKGSSEYYTKILQSYSTQNANQTKELGTVWCYTPKPIKFST